MGRDIGDVASLILSVVPDPEKTMNDIQNS